MSVVAMVGKDIRLDCPTVMFDNFIHQLVSGSLPSYFVGLAVQCWRALEAMEEV